jgi:hypothetical protein
MASPEQQIVFLSNVQRLLSEGSFVSTYKYALLLSLADLCVELGRDNDSALDIPTRRIGEKFAEYYWRQCAPYLPAGGEDTGVLKQNTGEAPRIIKLLHDVRGAYDGSLVNLRRDERAWNQTVTQIAAQVRKMPLWKLQTVGTQKLDFLYGKSGRGTSITTPADFLHQRLTGCNSRFDVTDTEPTWRRRCCSIAWRPMICT